MCVYNIICHFSDAIHFIPEQRISKVAEEKHLNYIKSLCNFLVLISDLRPHIVQSAQGNTPMLEIDKDDCGWEGRIFFAEQLEKAHKSLPDLPCVILFFF
ncbi:hypothetical protein SDC9_98257 [bioreactor metagenome]|uniref:Uncharacterized protein n=1 Tax=bioreactor metagenome TaxID=1076179 RepID=A0A645AFL3_9ZZZZ